MQRYVDRNEAKSERKSLVPATLPNKSAVPPNVKCLACQSNSSWLASDSTASSAAAVVRRM